jgi:hypothetical protein
MASGSRPVATARSWPRARLNVWGTVAGTALSSVTVILSAVNAISGPQAIAMAIPAMVVTIGGIFGVIVPEAWIAWRRGFDFGREAAVTFQTHRLSPGVSHPDTHQCAACGCRLR